MKAIMATDNDCNYDENDKIYTVSAIYEYILSFNVNLIMLNL